MTTINRLQAYKRIRESNGRIGYALFTKKDGQTRAMTFRTGVKRGVTGKGLAYEPEAHNLISVYDMDKKAFRMINLATIGVLILNKKMFLIE